MIVKSQVMINLWKRENQKSLPLLSENETFFNALFYLTKMKKSLRKIC